MFAQYIILQICVIKYYVYLVFDIVSCHILFIIDSILDSDISSHSGISSVSNDSCSYSGISNNLNINNIKIEDTSNDNYINDYNNDTNDNNNNINANVNNSNDNNNNTNDISNINTSIRMHPPTLPMDFTKSIFMKRTLKVIHMGLNTDNNQLIEDNWLKQWCQNKLRKSMEQVGDVVFARLIIKIQAQYINLLIVYTDENINHYMHLWSYLITDTESRWIQQKWWTYYYNKVWCVKNNVKKYVTEDLNKLPQNKQHLFIKNVNHLQMLKIIRTWVYNQHIDQQLLQYTNKGIELADIQISPTLMVFLYELSNALSQNQLVSQIRQTETNANNDTVHEYTSRQYTLPDSTLDWMHAAYINKNGLINLIVLYGWNDVTNTINDKLKNGITKQMDVKIAVKQWSKNSNMQLAIVETMAYMTMKYLMFEKLLHVGLKGAFWWTTDSFHSPLKHLWYTMKGIWYGHYFHQSCNKDTFIPKKSHSHKFNNLNFDNENIHNKNNDWTITATADDRLFWKISQCEICWMTAMSAQDIPGDKIIQSTMSFNDNSNLWTIPKSCGWGMMSNTTLKGLNTQANHVWKCGNVVTNKTDWKNMMATWNYTQISMENKQTSEQLQQILKQIEQKITDTLSYISCNWNMYAKTSKIGFKTNQTKKFCNTKFWKDKDVHPNDWPNNSIGNGITPLYYNDDFCGFRWRYRSKYQMNCVQSIEYTTCAHFLKKYGYIVTDSGLSVVGIQWYYDNQLPSDEERTLNGVLKTKTEIDNTDVDMNHKTPAIFNETHTTTRKTTIGNHMNDIVCLSSDSDPDDTQTISNMQNQTIDLINDIDSVTTTRVKTECSEHKQQTHMYNYWNNGNDILKHNHTSKLKHHTQTPNKNHPNIVERFNRNTRQSFVSAPAQNLYIENNNFQKPLQKTHKNTCNRNVTKHVSRQKISPKQTKTNNNVKSKTKNQNNKQSYHCNDNNNKQTSSSRVIKKKRKTNPGSNCNTNSKRRRRTNRRRQTTPTVQKTIQHNDDNSNNYEDSQDDDINCQNNEFNLNSNNNLSDDQGFDGFSDFE